MHHQQTLNTLASIRTTMSDLGGDDNVFDLCGSSSSDSENDQGISIENTDDEEEVDYITCPACQKETPILDTLQCQECSVQFETTKYGFIKDGFVQDDDEDIEFEDGDVGDSASEEEFDFNEEESDESDTNDEVQCESDEEEDDSIVGRSKKSQCDSSRSKRIIGRLYLDHSTKKRRLD